MVAFCFCFISGCLVELFDVEKGRRRRRRTAKNQCLYFAHVVAAGRRIKSKMVLVYIEEHKNMYT